MRSSHPPCLFPTWTGLDPQASKPCMQSMRQTCRWKGPPGLCQSSQKCHLYFPYLGEDVWWHWLKSNWLWCTLESHLHGLPTNLGEIQVLWPYAAPQKAENVVLLSKIRRMVLPGFKTLGSVVKQMPPRHTSHSTGVSQGPRGVPLADAVAFERLVFSKERSKTSAASKFCKAPEEQNEQSTPLSWTENPIFLSSVQGRTQRRLGKRIFQWHHVASPKKTSQETPPKVCSLEDCDNDMIDLIAPQVHTRSTPEHSLLTIAKKTQKLGGPLD